MTIRTVGTHLGLTGVVIAVAATVACSGENTVVPSPAPTGSTVAVTAAVTAVAATAPTVSTTPTGTGTVTGTAAVKKVNANTATRAEIQAALAAAGVPSPAQWAREVEEYRPYPADDPSWAKLRKELAKYNPAPGVVDQIIAVLTP